MSRREERLERRRCSRALASFPGRITDRPTVKRLGEESEKKVPFPCFQSKRNRARRRNTSTFYANTCGEKGLKESEDEKGRRSTGQQKRERKGKKGTDGRNPLGV